MANDITGKSKSSHPIGTFSEMYPIRHDAEADAIVLRLLTGDLSREGLPLLSAEPTPAERALVRKRADAIGKAMASASPGKIAELIAEMLIGFGGSRGSEDDAAAVVSQYVTVLKGYPLWAIKQACSKFASGSITEDDCEGWRKSFAPTTAQLCPVVDRIVKRHRDEATKLYAVLRGKVEVVLPPEEREQVGQLMASLAASMKADREAERREIITKEAPRRRETSEQAILREYEAAGVPPVRSSDGTLVSPSLLKSRNQWPPRAAQTEDAA